MEPTLAGWTIMIVSVGSVCALTVFCFYRLFTLPPREVAEAPREVIDQHRRGGESHERPGAGQFEGGGGHANRWIGSSRN